MAVISFKERHQGRRSSYRDGKLTHVREWLAITDDPTDGTAAAIGAAPSPGTGHPKDGAAKLNELDAAPHDNSDRHFLVTGSYISTGLVGTPANPLDRMPDISYGYQDATEPYFLDKSDPPKPAANSAGDPFEQYLERETGELSIAITINEAEFDPIAMDELKHTTNASAVKIDGRTYAAGTLKLTPQGARKVRERIEQDGAVADFTYYAVSYLLKARKAGWKDKPLDIGTNELVPDADPLKPKRLRPILDGASLPVKKGWPLDGEGRKKPHRTDKPAELELRPYAEANWSSLKFTNPAVWGNEEL